jgi:hypothetical protein
MVSIFDSEFESKEMAQNSSELASKVELEAMKDRVQLLCNQGVAAAISVWHDKVDLQLRGVERQMARYGVYDITLCVSTI